MPLQDLANTDVIIDWIDPSNDWAFYTVLEVDRGWIRLIGRDEPDGGEKWEGSPFWCQLSTIALIQETENVGKR